MPYSTLIIALLLTAGFHFGLVAAAAPLDGQRFAIDLKEGEKSQGKDTIVFAAGKGDCLTAGTKYKYEKGTYTTTKTPQGMTVTFTMMSVEHGQLVVTGTVIGNAITGTRTWSKPDKKPLVHQFTGTITH
jgi:hypothetical protein